MNSFWIWKRRPGKPWVFVCFAPNLVHVRNRQHIIERQHIDYRVWSGPIGEEPPLTWGLGEDAIKLEPQYVGEALDSVPEWSPK